MRCTSPLTVGFHADGTTLCWSPKEASKEFSTFQIPCGKCLSCRLQRARETAIRCVHEAQMHKDNCFITLTYSNETLGINKLDYRDFQTFLKKLRNNIFQEFLNNRYPGWSQKSQRDEWKTFVENNPQEAKEIYGKVKISCLVTGEYGEKHKRKHWHALIFNWRPKDATYQLSNERGDRLFSSKILDSLWGKGITNFGDVTLESAGYCARYATKKLSHGKDGEHEFEPISKRSTSNAIGKSWIAKYWPDVFNHGFIILPGGEKAGVPRYYEKWLRVHQPSAWEAYIKVKKTEVIEKAIAKEEKLTKEEKLINLKRSGLKGLQISRNEVRDKILKSNIEQIKKHSKF